MGANATVVVVSDYAWAMGGTEEFTLELIKGLDKHYRCHLLTWSHATPVPVGFQKVTTITNGDIRRAWQVIVNADYVIVVTSFNIRMLARLSLDVLSETKKPCMVVMQTSSHSEPLVASVSQQNKWISSLINLSKVTVCASDAVKNSVTPLLDINNNTYLTTIENGARLSDVSEHQRGRKNISFIGRPTYAKGFDLFLKLAADLKQDGFSFAANTVSIPPPNEVKGIKWSWCLNDADLQAFFANTDLLVVPYRSADGLPLAILEAINCGVPILALDSPAVSPLIRRYGQISIPHNYESFKEAVLDWSNESLVWASPKPSSINTLSRQIGKYVEIVSAELNS